MNIHEYQAKEIMRSVGIPVPNGAAILNPQQVGDVVKNFTAFPVVVKAQIHAGGRGKAGGVKLVHSTEEAVTTAREMFGKILHTKQTGPGGKQVNRVYIEDGSNIEKEYYISAVTDRQRQCITFIASSEGGMDIEDVAENDPSKIIHVPISPDTGIQGFHIRKIGFALNLAMNEIKAISPIVEGIYSILNKFDAEQVEINPLVRTTEGNFVALDAKIGFDHNALYRQKNIENMRDVSEENQVELEASKDGLNYVQMDGNIGCIVNGAGLAMATMDIIKYYGEQPANFLDVGGTTDEERVRKAFALIVRDENVKGIIVNIFGGIVKCDIIAHGIINAVKSMNLSIPIVVRLSGTNSELGKDLLLKSGLKIIPANDLEDAAQAIVKTIRGN